MTQPPLVGSGDTYTGESCLTEQSRSAVTCFKTRPRSHTSALASPKLTFKTRSSSQSTIYHDKQYAAGFKLRAAVLLVLNGSVIVLSVAYIVMLELQRRQSKPPQRWWLYQFVRRSTGELLVLNSRVIIAFLGVVSACAWIWIVVESIFLFTRHQPLGASVVARAFISCPIFLHGWVAVWSVFTTYVLTNQPDRSAFLSSIPAVVFNALFIGSSIAMLLGCIATGIWNLCISYKFWGSFTALETFLLRAAATYPNNPPDAHVELEIKSRSFSEASTQALYCLKWTYAILCIPAFMTLVISLTGLLLARDLGQHIRHSKKVLARNMTQPGSRSGGSCYRPEAPWMLIEGENAHGLRTNSPTSSSKAFVLNAEELRRIAQSDSIHGTRARTIALVTKARSELLLVSAYVGIDAAALIAMMIYVATLCTNGQLARGSGFATEVSAMGAAWLCSLCLGVATIALIYNNWVHRGGTGLLGLSQNILDGDELDRKERDTLYIPSAMGVNLDVLRPERQLRDDTIHEHHRITRETTLDLSKSFALPPLDL
ncbi:BQ2448_3967 [Microbotryum intermedium]|uniref:BQ2448_3967 protein n=1 Tax=Microbotryum intermedium TaxID=269621 RepID=A0A238FF40_9BASI|nr:BQ2448_3967 [Microbotryum intermedium]